jgi:endonuclease/exonuclease/phosphatase family metal-dependent hydrolase
MNDSITSETDVTFLIGDFNAEPESLTYRHLVESGFVSSFASLHGKEPEKTFPTGLQASFMDTDPPITVDFVWVRVGLSGKDTLKQIRVISS